MPDISIIELPFNLGLKQKSPDHEPGVNKLPAWLRTHHFHDLIQPIAIYNIPAPTYQVLNDIDKGVLNADAIVQYAHQEAALVNEVLSANHFPLVLGGDCSIVVGIALALKERGNYALFYLDGHTDFIEPELSGTKAIGGMAAAIAAGKGIKKLTNINEQLPYIKEELVWCVGNREYDDEYEDAVRFSEATYISLALLRKQGIAKLVQSFLEMVEQQQLDGFWLHIDLDVLDDAVMPAVDSRTPDGLRYEEFNQLIQLLLLSPKITGLDMTILDPDLDPTGEYTKAFVHNFTSTFNAAVSVKNAH